MVKAPAICGDRYNWLSGGCEEVDPWTFGYTALAGPSANISKPKRTIIVQNENLKTRLILNITIMQESFLFTNHSKDVSLFLGKNP